MRAAPRWGPAARVRPRPRLTHPSRFRLPFARRSDKTYDYVEKVRVLLLRTAAFFLSTWRALTPSIPSFPTSHDPCPPQVKQVMSSPGWATVTSNKLSLEDGGYLFFVLIDEVRRAPRARAFRGARPLPPPHTLLTPCAPLTATPAPATPRPAARARVHRHHLPRLRQPLHLL